MDALRWLETLSLVEALKSSFYIYPVVNALHIMALGVVFTTALGLDAIAIAGSRGVFARPWIELLRLIAFTAFAVAVATGLTLFSVSASEYFFNPAFRIKMLLLTLAGINLLLFRLFSDGRSPSRELIARLSAGFSVVLWISIVIAGRFIGFV